MHYKYPPVYKYIILLILITTFLKYYKVITVENYLLIASVFTYMVFIFDYVLIEEHPDLFYDDTDTYTDTFEKKVENKKIKKNKNNKKKKKDKYKENDKKNDKENESEKIKVINDLDDSIEENDIDELYNLDNTDTDDNLTEEIQRELDELI